MAQRLTYRRRLSYNTRSNRQKTVKTPGGNLRYIYTKRPASKPKCGDCGTALQAIPALRPFQLMSMKRTDKSVARPYGGSRCHTCVRQRIVRAFLIEEQKIVKRMVKSQPAAAAPAKKSKSKKTAKK